MRLRLLGFLGVVFVCTAAAAQSTWPRFRGPDADGVAPDNASLPMTWTTTENVKWVADIPGWGWSCPIVWGERVFLTSVVSEEENVAPSKGLYLGEGVREPANKYANERTDASVSPGPSAGAWQALPDMAVPRWEAGSVVFEDRLFVFGGYKMPTKACKRADVFDPKDSSWRQLAALPSAVTHMNLVLDVRFAERSTFITVLDRAGDH